MVEHTLSQVWGVIRQLSPTNTASPFINLRLCAVITDSQQQIGTEPDYHSMLQSSQWVSLWRWKRCLFWRCHSHPYQHPLEHLSITYVLALHISVIHPLQKPTALQPTAKATYHLTEITWPHHYKQRIFPVILTPWFVESEYCVCWKNSFYFISTVKWMHLSTTPYESYSVTSLGKAVGECSMYYSSVSYISFSERLVRLIQIYELFCVIHKRFSSNQLNQFFHKTILFRSTQKSRCQGHLLLYVAFGCSIAMEL